MNPKFSPQSIPSQSPGIAEICSYILGKSPVLQQNIHTYLKSIQNLFVLVYNYTYIFEVHIVMKYMKYT